MTDDEASHPAADRETLPARVEALHRRNALLEQEVARMRRQLASIAPLVEQARHLAFWDFTAYEVSPDDTWVAVDRAKAAALLGALARIDHWNPWTTTIEPRPRP